MTLSLEAKVTQLEARSFREKCESILRAKFPSITVMDVNATTATNMARALADEFKITASEEHRATWDKIDAEVNKYLHRAYPRIEK